MRPARRSFVLGAAAALVAAPRGALADTDDVLREIAAARDKVKTLVAKLSQERTLSLLQSKVTSKGELTIVRPDKLRWDLEPPDAATYWVTPQGIAYKTPNGKGKVSKDEAGAFGAILGDLLVMLGGDLLTLKDRWKVSAKKEKDDGGATLELSPKDEKVQKLVSKITVKLRSNLVAPRSFVMDEAGDDKTVVTFEPAELDAKVPPEKMKPD